MTTREEVQRTDNSKLGREVLNRNLPSKGKLPPQEVGPKSKPKSSPVPPTRKIKKTVKVVKDEE